MNRIKKASVLAAALLLLCGLAVYFQSSRQPMRYTATFFDMFDTRTEIVGYASNEEEFTRQAELLADKLLYYHRLYDIYNDYEGISNLKTINEKAGIEPVKVEREIIELLKFGKEMYEVTDGQMNIAMGSVLRIWHDYREAGRNDPSTALIPPMESLEQAAGHTDIRQVIIDEENETVYLADAEMSLDVGSIGKGYAVQQVAEYAREIGMDSVLFSVGGNVCAVGSKPEKDLWRVGIQNPDTESNETYLRKVEIADACVVTSGNYQRYYTVNGVRYSHIIDPDTLMPAEYAASVSVVTRDSGVADALSTAVYNMPYEQGRAWVASMDGVEAMWIFGDGSIRYSDGFEDYMVQ
ncbi:MAG: FAD:protein FMN transferase [Roseburia sp.]